MIQVIRGRGGGSAAMLDAMFADRKRLFVDLLRWNVPVVRERFEIDAFDDDHAVYIVATDATGHAGSLRLLPTTRPHLLDSLFAELCPLGVPCDARTWEITRLCLPQRLGAAGRLDVRNALIVVMIDHCVATGIARLTGVVEATFRDEVLTMGWRAEPLGPATRLGSARLGAFALHVDAHTPERLRWTGIAPASGGTALEVAP